MALTVMQCHMPVCSGELTTRLHAETFQKTMIIILPLYLPFEYYSQSQNCLLVDAESQWTPYLKKKKKEEQYSKDICLLV
jgi:hypothetical protein